MQTALATCGTPVALSWVNPDFDLGRERVTRAMKDAPSFTSRTSEASKERFARMQSLFMHSYRESVSAAVLQNKLLCNALFNRLGLPVIPVTWGAFGRDALGGYPKYSRPALCSALDGLGEQKEFVLKTVTDGMEVGVLLMSQARWEAEGWTCDRVVAKMEPFIVPSPSVDNVTSRWYSRWGVKYEQRGLMLQKPAFDLNFMFCHRAVVPHEQFRPPAFCATHPLAVASVHRAKTILRASTLFYGEVKLFVAYGSLQASLPFSRPLNCPPKSCSYGGYSRNLLRFNETDETPGNHTAWTPLDIAAQRVLNHHADQLRAIASTIFNATGIDWFRLDVFFAPSSTVSSHQNDWPSLLINEIEYPGGVLPDALTPLLQRFVEGYMNDASGFRDPRRPTKLTVMELAGVTDADITSEDYMSMHRPANKCFWERSSAGTAFDGMLSHAVGPGKRVQELAHAKPISESDCGAVPNKAHHKNITGSGAV